MTPAAKRQSYPAAAPQLAAPTEKQSIKPELARRDAKRLVVAMAQEGHSKAEIAATLGITMQAVSSIMIRAGIGTGRFGATRRVHVRIPIRLFRVLRLLAEERHASPSATLAQLVKAPLSDLPTARKMARRG